MTEPPSEFDIREEFARIDRRIAEIRELAEESQRRQVTAQRTAVIILAVVAIALVVGCGLTVLLWTLFRAH